MAGLALIFIDDRQHISAAGLTRQNSAWQAGDLFEAKAVALRLMARAAIELYQLGVFLSLGVSRSVCGAQHPRGEDRLVVFIDCHARRQIQPMPEGGELQLAP